MGSKIRAKFGQLPQDTQQLDFYACFSLSYRSSVGRVPIDVERSTSHKNLNAPEDFDISDLKNLSLNEKESNVKIWDNEEEVELLVNHLRVYKWFFDKLGKLVLGGCIMSNLQGGLHMELWNAKLMKNSSLENSGVKMDIQHCKNLLLKFMKTNEDHKVVMICWEVRYFLWGNNMPIEQHIHIIIQKEQKIVLLAMKFLYFII